METKIKWNDGEGHITTAYTGEGNDSVAVSSDVNEGIDRTQNITVKTTKGNLPKTQTVTVTQLGMREIFNASDNAFILADGSTFNVLKNYGV